MPQITINLSDKSVRAIREMKDLSGAHSDSEVLRDALRLYLTLLRSHDNGVQIFMKRNGEADYVPVSLFEAVEGEGAAVA